MCRALLQQGVTVLAGQFDFLEFVSRFPKGWVRSQIDPPDVSSATMSLRRSWGQLH